MTALLRALLFVLAISLLSPAPTWSQEASATSVYHLREGPTFLGFKLDPPVDATATIPFDRPYSALTKQQQDKVKSSYVKLGETDEPPYPLEGLRAIYDPMAEGQRRLHVDGEFSANVEVNAEGVATAVSVLRTPNRNVTNFVAAIVLLTKFKPAICDGTPCAMGFPVRMQFKME